MKNILILEDQELYQKILIKLIQEIDGVDIHLARTSEQAYRQAMEIPIHLFLVDIILDTKTRGDVSGLNFVEAIRKVPQYSNIPLIFITSLEDPRLYTFKNLNCYGYIEKPYDAVQVKRLIKKALNFPGTQEEHKNIYFRVDSVMYSVNSADIIYIERSRRHLNVHTRQEILHIPYKTLRQILKEIGSDHFIQCNRYTIVNKRFIESVDNQNRYIKLRGVKTQIELGSELRKRIWDEFDD